MRILITGATGLLGKEIGKVLSAKGHDLVVVARSASRAREVLPFPCEIIEGDLSVKSLDDARLQHIEAVINLMGEPVVGERWNEDKKRKIYDSRVQGTRNLVASLPQTLSAFVSSSAMGIYGDRQEELLTEDSSAGEDFLAKVCLDWEKEAHQAPGRVVCIRTSVVLAQQGGALDKMLFPFRAGVGGVLGSGEQWMSWIHLKDIVGLFVFALENENVRGAVNGSAPEAVTNRRFSEALAKAVGRKLGPPVPLIALRTLYGEAAASILAAIRLSAEKILSLGYSFQCGDLSKALDELCAPFRQGEELFVSEQFVPHPPETIFPFFKNAHNLEQLTPPSLGFHIEKISTEDIQQGTLIEYQLNIRGVPVKWKTEIDEWQPPFKFVDNQVRGPYRLWHHTHEFHSVRGGALMVDKVRYQLPGGYLGWLAASHVVRKEVETIFAFRRRYLANLKSF